MGCQGIIKTSEKSLVFNIYMLLREKEISKLALLILSKDYLFYSVLKQRAEKPQA